MFKHGLTTPGYNVTQGIRLSMIDRIFLIVACSLLLSACASPKPPNSYDISKNEASLSEASYSVSRSIVDLAETAQAAHPLPCIL